MGRKPNKRHIITNHVGMTVTVYAEPHFKEKPLGVGVLVRCIEPASHQEAFILKDMRLTQQEVWSIELWDVEWIDLTDLGKSYHFKLGEITRRKFRALLNVGVTPSGKTSHKEVTRYRSNVESFPSHLTDNFEIVPGWGQCF